MSSPTKRTLDYLRARGATCQIVEKFNQFSKTRLDLFGCIDVVALMDGEIWGIQATSNNGGNHSAHLKKCLDEPRLKTWLQSGGRFLIVSWAKQGERGKVKRWTPRIQEITVFDFPATNPFQNSLEAVTVR